jgi:hypothetical protein
METIPRFTSSTPTEYLESFAEAILHQALKDAKEDGSWVPQVLKDDLRMQVPELRMGSKCTNGSGIRAVKISGIIRTTPKVFISQHLSHIFYVIRPYPPLPFTLCTHILYSNYLTTSIQ